MRMFSFAKRNAKEIVRDPLTIAFSLGFPLVLLALLSAINLNVDVPLPLFDINSLTPGVAVFGLSFMTLFSATLVARDRETALLTRLYTTPMRPYDFILGYMLPIIPIAAAQAVTAFAAALIVGLKPTVNIIYAVLFIIPISLFYVSMGLLFGSILNVKQAGAICGALFTNLAAWLSNIWFDVSLVGSAFDKIAHALPFIHAVELERALISGSFSDIWVNLAVVLGYAVLASLAAILLFLRGMKRS